MKKIVGIIAALTLLCSVASAATLTGSAEYKAESQEVVAIYTGYTEGTQATLLAYDVTDIEGATEATAFIDTTETPIVGIDQGDANGTFSFPVPAEFTGKIVVMVGGKDVETPISALVVVEDGSVEEITIIWGDINDDGTVDSTDGTFIINSTIGSGKTNENNDYEIGKPFAYDSTGKELIWGDVNGDGTVDSTDGTFIINSTIGSGKTNENNDYEIGETYKF